MGNNEKGQRKKCQDSFFFYMRIFFSNNKEKKMMQRMSEINDNRMHMDLTRSTTSRHAAIVKRTFERARDPQRMWISRDYHKMRYGQKHFCYKGNFCGKRCSSKQEKKVKRDFLRRSKNQFFFLKNGLKNRKMINELLFFSDVK